MSPTAVAPHDSRLLWYFQVRFVDREQHETFPLQAPLLWRIGLPFLFCSPRCLAPNVYASCAVAAPVIPHLLGEGGRTNKQAPSNREKPKQKREQRGTHPTARVCTRKLGMEWHPQKKNKKTDERTHAPHGPVGTCTDAAAPVEGAPPPTAAAAAVAAAADRVGCAQAREASSSCSASE